MASVMSPLIRSFPDMKASVGFSFPETRSKRLSAQKCACVTWAVPRRRLTCKHLAKVTGVHRHDDVGFDRWLTLPCAASRILQVQKPNACMLTWYGHYKNHMRDTPTGCPQKDAALSCCYLTGQTDKCPALTSRRLHWWLPWWRQTCFLLVHWGTPWLLRVVWRRGSHLKTKQIMLVDSSRISKDRRWSGVSCRWDLPCSSIFLASVSGASSKKKSGSRGWPVFQLERTTCNTWPSRGC